LWSLLFVPQARGHCKAIRLELVNYGRVKIEGEVMRKMVWLVAVVVLICSAVVVANERTKEKKEQTKNVASSSGYLDCSSATVIGCNSTLYGEETSGWPNVDYYSCVFWTETGGERVYELTVEAYTRIIVSLEPIQGDPDVFLLGSCDEADCLAVGEDGLTYLAIEGGVYYIVVDGHLDGPDCVFDLTVTCEEASPPPANDTCDGAIDLEDQGLPEFEVNLCDYTNQYDPLPFGCTGFRALGPEAVYKIDLDEDEWFRASISISNGFIDHSLYLITDCDDPVGSCVAGSDEFSYFPRPEFISYQADASGTYYMMVDSYLDCGGGLTNVWFSTLPPPVNDTCDGAIDLVEQGLPEFIIDLRIYTNQVGENGPEAFYRIDLDEGEVFAACVEPIEFDFGFYLYLITDCEDIEGSLVAHGPNCIFYPADANGTYYLFVDSGGSGGPVEVSYETGGPFTGLVGYYPFFGDADDHSGHGHDGVVYGATLTEDRFGNPDAAYHFDGVGLLQGGSRPVQESPV